MPSSSRPVLGEKILVRGVNWLGDAIMTMPAVERLRAARPEAEIILATPEKIAPIWERSPAINSVLSLSPTSSVFEIGRTLKGHRFQIGVLFPNSPRVALEAFLGGIPVRRGYAARWRRWLLTDPVAQGPEFVRMRKRGVVEIQRLAQAPPAPAATPAPGAHQIHHYLRLVAGLGASPEPLAPRIWVDNSEVDSFLEKFGVRIGVSDSAPLLGMNPGAEYGPAKRWPWERFAAAAVVVSERTGGRWLIFGGKGDVEIAAQIEHVLRKSLGSGVVAGINLAGRTSLRELCAGLKACELVLTNDTGPMHVAAAVGTKVIALFGSTSPGLTGPGLPGGEGHLFLHTDVACAPCFLPECPIDFRCMTGLSVERVVSAVLDHRR